jgi:hypothetical protein
MSGLTPLVDTLLATRLAQRVDLVPLKSELEVAGPGAVAQVEKVTNDVRLPSRAGMLQQLGVGLLKAGDSSHATAPARAGENVTLSTAARTVSAILEASSGATAKITGTEPLWPKAQPPLAPVLSATLARTVANSGLFYESHLAQFAAGTRTLAQLAQEPQARLDASVKLALALPVAEAAGQGAGVGGMAAATPAGRLVEVPIFPVADAAGQDAGMSDMAMGTGRLVEALGLPGVASVQSEAGDAASIDSGKPGGAASLPNSVPGGGPASSPDAAPLSHSSDPTHLHKNAYESIQNAEGQEPAAKNHGAGATDAARSNAPGLAGIHPDAVALVRQQLELLAVPVFRWVGEAWPGVPMDWEIHEKAQEDQNKRQAAADNEAVPRTWSTRVALTLPTLKDIEVRISLVGTALQVHLAASENATREVLGEARTELPKRLSELGLQLTGLQIGLLAAPSATQARPEDDDARK